jgi:hypothetical protein
VTPDANSIETCLVNVRDSHAVIVVLSQRYGPSLKGVGYEDISATHLEYREAREHSKVLMYVRDRLEAEFAMWRRAPRDPWPGPWVQPGSEKLFHLLNEHREFVEGQDKSNWYWTFRDTVDLKERIRKDLGLLAGTALMQRLIDQGAMPFFDVKVEKGEGGLQFVIQNVGGGSALNGCLRVPWQITFGALPPGGGAVVTGELPIAKDEDGSPQQSYPVDVLYSTPCGLNIVDRGRLDIPDEAVMGVEASPYATWVFQSKELQSGSAFALGVSEEYKASQKQSVSSEPPTTC